MVRFAVFLIVVLALVMPLQAENDLSNNEPSFGLSSAECHDMVSAVRQQKSQAGCMLTKHDEVVFQLFSYFKKGDAVLTYFDPVACPDGEEAPPFEITSVTFTLAHP